ncbi:branched-chain amino acid ABC transporter permease [Agrobacterium larrymoorei]|uniref:Branched-chain amino acid ABC transporter permease n=1 Tax=Agrobacterium larrymoorei TaxID=160699 RepID=A0A4D7E1T3_9HYPH|nr:branched-chain amino acid ABC transporter permease [Agrobacterium larrymoorei]QCJ01165.1 branched-chain amino acid ABC transporter permease [Agrobacterium larrymoorei]QYA10175.1 branched-chain amino acid ABC transporter permease [Agrobacterium larrymoorei]
MSESAISLREQRSDATTFRSMMSQGRVDAVVLTVLLILPFLISGSWNYALGLCFANSIGVLAVSVLVRYGGEVSIGHSFFAAIGAYSVAILETHLGLPLVVSLPVAVFAGTLFGILFAWPSRRLSGIYLAVSTMALALALPEIIISADRWTGGFEGLYVSKPLIPGLPIEPQRYYVTLIVLAAVVYALVQLRQSRQGRALLLARTHSAAAEAFGTRRAWARVSVMGISGGIAAISGAMLAFGSSAVSPTGYTFWSSIFLLVGSVVSFYGLTLTRALIGGAFLTLIPQFLSGSGAWIPVFYGVALIAVVLLGHFSPRIAELVARRRGAK